MLPINYLIIIISRTPLYNDWLKTIKFAFFLAVLFFIKFVNIIQKLINLQRRPSVPSLIRRNEEPHTKKFSDGFETNRIFTHNESPFTSLFPVKIV